MVQLEFFFLGPLKQSEPSLTKKLGVGDRSSHMGGCQNSGPCLGVHINGDIEINVDIDTDS